MAKGLEKSFFYKIQNKLLVKNSADLNRIYLLVIFIHSPLFSFLLYDGNLKLLLVNILVSLISGLIILTSYYSEKVKNNIANIVYIFFYAVIVYISTLAYITHYTLEFSFGLLAVLLFFEMLIETKQKLVWFTVPVILYNSVLISVSNTTHVEKAFIIIGLVVFSFFVYFTLLRKLQLQKELEDSEKKFRTVIDISPVIIWGIDKNGIITLSEGRGLKALNITPGQIEIGRAHV